MNRLRLLHGAGQSVWLDFLSRGLITSGRLARFVTEDLVSGVTSNPTIFSHAIGRSADYDEAVATLAGNGRSRALDIFYDLALEDVSMAADVLRPVYDATNGADGFVSFELEPRLAHDCVASIAAALVLFDRLGKPNTMIKVPGTAEGVAAVEELTARGVNVNITLLFSLERYEQIAKAYIDGLDRRLALGQPIDRISSVASFFVSRVDTMVDARLPDDNPLRGRVAIANARVAYQRFRTLFSGDRWRRIAAAGGRLQRPLWASTGTKNPAYSDVRYVEELVGPDTVNTMPKATLDAFRDHGRVRPDAASAGAQESADVISQLPLHGVDLDDITSDLVEKGLQAFESDLRSLLAVIDEKVSRVHPDAGSEAV